MKSSVESRATCHVRACAQWFATPAAVCDGEVSSNGCWGLFACLSACRNRTVLSRHNTWRREVAAQYTPENHMQDGWA